MNKNSKYSWYLIDIVIFLLINVILLKLLGNRLGESFQQINWTTIIILALGIWRLTDVLTHESVTDVFRAPFEGKTEGFMGFFGDLISCNACMGVWVSMIVFYGFLFFPQPMLVFMIIMTLTCFERFLSKIYNFLEKRG